MLGGRVGTGGVDGGFGRPGGGGDGGGGDGGGEGGGGDGAGGGAAGEGHGEGGADVNLETIEGATPLVAAAQWGHLDVVKWLAGKGPGEGGADVNKARDTGATPLWKAAQNGHDAVVRYALWCGVMRLRTTHLYNISNHIEFICLGCNILCFLILIFKSEC